MSFNQNKYNTTRRRTKDGLISKIYAQQLASSRKRKHPKPTYTNKELNKWIKSHCFFNYIYNEWILSGYDRNMIPSIDRINDDLPYTTDNIRLTVWHKNNTHGHKNRTRGISKQGSLCKEVIQISFNGEEIARYHSTAEAYRATGVSHVSCVCTGNRSSAGGFIWKYA